MKKLEIYRDKMLKAVEECPDVKEVFKTLWPEEFLLEWVDVVRECKYRHKGGHLYIAYQEEEIGVISYDGPRIFYDSKGVFRIEQGPPDSSGHYNFRILKRK